ncbi:hypothetical protein HGG64_02065 [Mycoplasma phocoeninasale]|uniref:GGDEF domain-containing protein n=1 Tax=Mycoplasma phocoeninasale TaxID=2726117 RepID=A0A858U3C0_9MOLU|nr:DHH family phosphoesterase [Mycoplasma phocoeninasale]QJG66481.1 hypothetical protein HGG64_02065 [Mycoplasma phocoeninasale]
MNDKNRKKIHLILQIIFLFLLPSILFYVVIFKLSDIGQIIAAILYTVYIIGLGSYLAVTMTRYLKNIAVSQSSLNYYIQREISQYGVGAIVFMNTGKIIWISDMIKNNFGKKIISKNIKEIFKVDEWRADNLDFSFSYNDIQYEVHVSLEHNIVILKDITMQTNLLNDYRLQRIVFGELNIDNINLYQNSLSQEQLFKLYSSVVNLLDDLSKKYNLIYRQYENGRFFIITNQETLEKFEQLNFEFFNELKQRENLKDDITVTVSAGFSYGIYKYDLLDQMAKEALLQSQTRGGDQVTILTKDEKPRHYGSSSEIDVNLSRTNVKFMAKNLLLKLKSKMIQKVIIYGHKNADLDAFGSCYAIYTLAKTFNKKAYIQNQTFDDTTTRIFERLDKEEQNDFISPKDATALNDDKTLVVLCDTSDETRIENINAFNGVKRENILVIDHHRIGKNQNFAIHENFYVDSSASSASEIVTEMIAISNNHDKINTKVAQHLLDGIYLDTNTFQKQTTAKTFIAASLLQEWGAKIIHSVNTLKMNEKMFNVVQELLENLQEVKSGYYLAYKNIEASTDMISIATDEILRVNGRKAAFVVAKLPGVKKYKMSARGNGVNVQLIAELVGGGGHFGTAAAESSESMELFIDNIKQAIVSVKDESNIN